uniref:Candidate tumor suppressor protein n=1 Tax=Angiostrongylus costaricensis TaxID=334426 RepID=A0A0R3PUM3_ANGCS
LFIKCSINLPRFQDHSPGLSQKIKIPKKRYSYADPLQRMDTPVFDKNEVSHVKKGPSSAATVLTMAGLFVVGILLMMSGIIVLLEHTETPFIITGCMFLGVGFAMLLVCAVLQRKNIVKFVLDLNSDLYFLNMNKSYMWKVMFENRAELPLSE